MKFQFIDLYLLTIDRKIFLYLLILYEKSYQMIKHGYKMDGKRGKDS